MFTFNPLRYTSITNKIYGPEFELALQDNKI